MITFKKFAAGSNGEEIRRYFTQQPLDAEEDPAPDDTQRALDPGSKLTDYFTGGGAKRAWRADMPLAIAHALGVNPHQPPKDEDLDRLFEGKRADNGEAWSKQRRDLSGYDFTFSPHKSVTLAAAFAANPAEAAAIRTAIWRANQTTMRYIAREIGWARRGRAGEGGAEPGAVAWVSFRHHDARPTVAVQDGRDGATTLFEPSIAGDPHEHIHNAMFNVVVTENGHVGSLDTKRLQARVHEFGAFGQAVLADELRALGVRVDYDEKQEAAVIPQIPLAAVKAFSKGRHQVLANAKAFAISQGLLWDDLSGKAKKKLLREAGDASRLAKHGEKTQRQVWNAQAEEIGWKHETVFEGVAHAVAPDAERYEQAYAVAARHLAADFSKTAAIDHDKLRVHAARGLIGAGVPGGFRDIDRVVELIEHRGIELHGEQVQLVTGWAKRNPTDAEAKQVLRVTHSAQIRIEQSLQRLAARAAADESGALSTKTLRRAIEASGLDFDSEPEHGAAQKAAIYALGRGGALSLLTGVAGAGKSTLLKPLVAAWKTDTRFNEDGREILGLSTAWRQADQLEDTGIRWTKALEPFLTSIEKGEFQPTRNTILVIDEVSQIAPRAMLRLLELQSKTGMTIKALGDREQAQAIEAGDSIELLRRALPLSAQPELLTTVRQYDRRHREIAGLFREGAAEEALAMKRHDGSAMLIGGDQDQVVAKIADFYLNRRDILRATDPKRRVSVSALTNEDARAISFAIRERLKARGEIGDDEKVYRAMAPRGLNDSHAYDLPIATGDHLRLYRRAWGRVDGKKRPIGSNGHVVTVMGKTADGLLLRNHKGETAEVEWGELTHANSKRLMLSLGHVLTVDSAQGMTSDEHINALPRGSAGITAFKAYVAESRARAQTWTMISEAAIQEAEKRSRALGDAKPITAEHLWRRVAEDMSQKPYKPLGIDVVEALRQTTDRVVDSFLKQSRAFHAWAAAGKDPARQARDQAQANALGDRVGRRVAEFADDIKSNASMVQEALRAAAGLDRARPAPVTDDSRASTTAVQRPSSPSPGA